jgi:hypothetical protein
VRGQATLPALNVALYNVAGVGGDSTLYGHDTPARPSVASPTCSGGHALTYPCGHVPRERGREGEREGERERETESERETERDRERDGGHAGTEPWWYYAANGAINLNLALPLAAALPLALALRRTLVTAPAAGKGAGAGAGDEWAVLVGLYAPAALWFVFLSLQVTAPSYSQTGSGPAVVVTACAADTVVRPPPLAGPSRSL